MKHVIVKLIVLAILVCLFMALYIQLFLLPKGPQKSETVQRKNTNNNSGTKGEQHGEEILAVIVPYRDRFEELQIFVPFIDAFLTRQNIKHLIYIVNQVDAYRFNRAALINIGHQHARSRTTYMVMHDVDLLPLNNNLSYGRPPVGQVMHIAAPGLHPRYDYPTFIGGILIVSNEEFEKVNGMSNLYFGWGLEDDEFYVRLKQNEIKVIRPTTVTTNKSTTFKHIHSSRPRDMTNCHEQYKKLKKRDRRTGLNNVNYTLVSTTKMMIESTSLTVLNVKLICDTKLSPWCEYCSKPTSKNKKTP